MKNILLSLVVASTASFTAETNLMKQASVEYKSQNYEKAFELSTEACDSGNVEGCRMLGIMYEVGNGVEIDFNKAVEQYAKACNNTHASLVPTF